MSDNLPLTNDISIELVGGTVVLKPTLQAAIRLSTMRGGLTEMINRCQNIDFEAISDVIIYGSGMKVEADTKQRIFETGLVDLFVPCISYLNLLANGGRKFDEKREETEDPKAPNSQ